MCWSDNLALHSETGAKVLHPWECGCFTYIFASLHPIPVCQRSAAFHQSHKAHIWCTLKPSYTRICIYVTALSQETQGCFITQIVYLNFTLKFVSFFSQGVNYCNTPPSTGAISRLPVLLELQLCASAAKQSVSTIEQVQLGQHRGMEVPEARCSVSLSSSMPAFSTHTNNFSVLCVPLGLAGTVHNAWE